MSTLRPTFFSAAITVVLVALPGLGCDSAAKTEDKAAKTEDKAAKADKKSDAEDGKPVAEAAEKAPEDPMSAMLASRTAADTGSGLGVGGKFSAFDIINVETGKSYCQVCEFGPSPKILAAGVIDDEAFKKDVRDLDAIVKKYGDDKIKAFAVITELKDGRAVTSVPPDDAQKAAAELQKELGVSMPIVIAAPDDGKPNRIWDEYYAVTKSRTIMFADGRNQVRWAGVASPDFADLNTAIEEVLKG